jgi:small subunit ribosomal protein S15
MARAKSTTNQIDFLKQSKEELIKKFAQSEGDTGSPEVQIALLTQRILLLQQHLLGHKKDNHSRRGLLQMVGKRRRLLEYIKKVNSERYQTVLKAIDLAK